MWFKNLTVFKLRQATDLAPLLNEPQALAAKLSDVPFRPCSSQETLSDGWVAPLGRKYTDLVHAVNGCLLVCLQIEEKVLPAAVIKELLADKVGQIEDREARAVRRKEKEQLRDELLLELLPRAFTRSRRSYAYIDTQEHWLVIDSASPKAIEEVTEQLRETLGSLPITPPKVGQAPGSVMTHWLGEGAASLPAKLQLEDECELRGGDGVVRCKGQDLAGDEIQVHLQAGKQATRLALSWNERLAFVLSDDLLIRRLRFLDLVQEQLDDVRSDDDAQLFDAEMALMTGEIRAFLPELLSWFGGELEP